ncbi:MAG: 4-hydroxythreonine-4-phosphate dehydrogenase PdxA [Acidobacteriota bacterium]|nr:MAG: 4-hydroxythreonine-4-phosphate dehydrogenase PdxA [Acidobacteriota bacterium]
MGDPHGIGPEILLKSLVAVQQQHPLKATIFGSGKFLSQLDEHLRLDLDWSAVEVCDVGDYPYPPPWGTVSSAAGAIAYESLRQAVLHCRDERISPLVTAPVNKQSLHLHGFTHPGQTEFVGSFFEGAEPTMAFFSEQMNVLLGTVHCSLREVFAQLKADRLERKCSLFYRALESLGHENPRIAVAGLNPHASEGGLFGREEEQILEPLVSRLQQAFGSGSFSGPYPPDTIFRRVLAGDFSGIVALYHDQGLIPLKLVAFDTAVNVTLGMPIIRSSPDHGTAFDIAGSNQASYSSMLLAIEIGLKLSAGR